MADYNRELWGVNPTSSPFWAKMHKSGATSRLALPGAQTPRPELSLVAARSNLYHLPSNHAPGLELVMVLRAGVESAPPRPGTRLSLRPGPDAQIFAERGQANPVTASFVDPDLSI